jgi:hypothetical protein
MCEQLSSRNAPCLATTTPQNPHTHARTSHARNAAKAYSCRDGRNTSMSAACGTFGNARRATMPLRLSFLMKRWRHSYFGSGTKRKTASRRSLRNPIKCFDQAASAAFRFLRQPSRPKAPRPVAKSGRAAGSGVPETTLGTSSVATCPK